MLWAITSYFNPCDYQSRRDNYQIFRQHLDAPLIAIELGFDGRFDLTENDADILIRIEDGDVMFQKERLLNILIEKHLPDDCEFVAWLDCDVVFERKDWAEQAKSQLSNRTQVVQLFSACAQPLVADIPVWSPADRGIRNIPGVVKRYIEGTLEMEKWIESGGSAYGKSGLAWAARREWIAEIPFYDACIVGSGSRLVTTFCLKCPERFTEYMQMNPLFAEHYADWLHHSQRWGDFEVDCVEGNLWQLWHGDYERRSYRERHEHYRDFSFSPERDLQLGRDGAWKWTDPQGRLAQYVADYFRSRREDGDSQIPKKN